MQSNHDRRECWLLSALIQPIYCHFHSGNNYYGHFWLNELVKWLFVLNAHKRPVLSHLFSICEISFRISFLKLYRVNIFLVISPQGCVKKQSKQSKIHFEPFSKEFRAWKKNHFTSLWLQFYLWAHARLLIIPLFYVFNIYWGLRSVTDFQIEIQRNKVRKMCDGEAECSATFY